MFNWRVSQLNGKDVEQEDVKQDNSTIARRLESNGTNTSNVTNTLIDMRTIRLKMDFPYPLEVSRDVDIKD